MKASTKEREKKNTLDASLYVHRRKSDVKIANRISV